MKKQLLLSALALLGAGVIGGCCNCGSDGEEVMEVETVEIVPCQPGKNCPSKSHHHLRQKGPAKPAAPDASKNCGSNSSCTLQGRTAIADCGADHSSNSGEKSTSSGCGGENK